MYGGLLISALLIAGCRSKGQPVADRELSDITPVTYTTQRPVTSTEPVSTRLMDTPPPRTLRNMAPSEIWDMRIEEALKIAVEHSKVILDAGGRVLASPTNVQTTYDPAIRETNPLTGPAAALSAFDAQFSSATYCARATISSTILCSAAERISLPPTSWSPIHRLPNTRRRARFSL